MVTGPDGGGNMVEIAEGITATEEPIPDSPASSQRATSTSSSGRRRPSLLVTAQRRC
jgi:hypothetical protein